MRIVQVEDAYFTRILGIVLNDFKSSCTADIGARTSKNIKPNCSRIISGFYRGIRKREDISGI